MRHRIQGTLFCILELKKYVKCTNNDSSVGKESLYQGKDYPLQYSGLENSMDYIVHGVAKSWTQLSDFRIHLWAQWAGKLEK